MRLAITGTPGCGKTALADLLRAEGATVTTVEALADAAGALAGHDDEDDADIVDVDALHGLALPPEVVIDGHLSHLLPVDMVWVVRCDPALVRQRLEDRGYGPEKVAENVEAEAMDLILQEALDQGVPVVQRDGTRRQPEVLLSAFQEAGPGPLKSHDIEAVDWSHRLLE